MEIRVNNEELKIHDNDVVIITPESIEYLNHDNTTNRKLLSLLLHKGVYQIISLAKGYFFYQKHTKPFAQTKLTKK